MIISSELWVPEEGQGGDESETLAWEELIMKEDNWEDQEDVGEAKVWQCLSYTVGSIEVKCATPE